MGDAGDLELGGTSVDAGELELDGTSKDRRNRITSSSNKRNTEASGNGWTLGYRL